MVSIIGSGRRGDDSACRAGDNMASRGDMHQDKKLAISERNARSSIIAARSAHLTVDNPPAGLPPPSTRAIFHLLRVPRRHISGMLRLTARSVKHLAGHQRAPSPRRLLASIFACIACCSPLALYQ